MTCHNSGVKVFPRSLSPRTRWLRTPLNRGDYRHWLTHQGSLTKRLQAHAASFAVQTLRVIKAKAQADEAGLLCLPARQLTLLREVHLNCDGVPVVFAHSVLPLHSLRGPWHGLGKLGNRSLGSTLFADPRVLRAPLQYKKLSRHHALYRRAANGLAQPPATLWARRSVFRLGHAAILVTEVFLPTLLK